MAQNPVRPPVVLGGHYGRYGLIAEIMMSHMNTAAPLRMLVPLLLPLVAVTPLLGQHMNEKDSPCPNAVATSDMVHCFSKAKESSDVKLSRAYKDLLNRLQPKDAERLTQVQRLWAQYRDANCSAERGLYEGGSAAAVVYLACFEAMTRARTEELKRTYAVALKQ